MASDHPSESACAGRGWSLPVEKGTQRDACARDARHHSAHRDVQDLGAFGVGQLFQGDQQQRLALLRRKPAQRRKQVHSQAGIFCEAAAGRVDLVEELGVDADHAGAAAPLVPMRVVRNAQHPHENVAALVELMPMSERSLQCGLNEIVSRAGIEYQGAGIPPQARNGAQKLVAKGVGSGHTVCTRKGLGEFPPGLVRSQGYRDGPSRATTCERAGAQARRFAGCGPIRDNCDMTPPSKALAPSFSALEFRAALGMFATGVTIVTARDAAGQRIGLTANSFNSVSMQPPLVLWSLSRAAGSMPAFTRGSHYAINILSAEQWELAERFSRKAPDRFAGVDCSEGAGGAPILNGAAAVFECFNRSRYAEGDHVIFVGEVEHCTRREGAQPLIFHGGRYFTELPL